MKRIIIKLYACITALALCVCAVIPAAAETVGKITPQIDVVNLYVGETYQLRYQIPASVTNRKVTFQSSDERALTVNTTGLLTAKDGGTMTVTITGAAGLEPAEITVKIRRGEKPQQLLLEEKEMEVAVGAHKTILATVRPAEANQTIYYTSLTPSVATVNRDGVVTGVKSGMAEILVESMSSAVAQRCIVKVRNAEAVDAARVTITGRIVDSKREPLVKTELRLLYGDNYVSAWTDENGYFTWKDIMQNNYIFCVVTNYEVAASGKVQVKQGQTVYAVVSGMDIAVAYNRPEASPVTIQKVNLSKGNVSLKEGETYQMIISTEPKDQDVQQLVMTSENESVATVDSTGLITAIKPGMVTITFRTADGSVMKNCEVKVEKTGSTQYSWLILAVEVTLLGAGAVLFVALYRSYLRQEETRELREGIQRENKSARKTRTRQEKAEKRKKR